MQNTTDAPIDLYGAVELMSDDLIVGAHIFEGIARRAGCSTTSVAVGAS